MRGPMRHRTSLPRPPLLSSLLLLPSVSFVWSDRRRWEDEGPRGVVNALESLVASRQRLGPQSPHPRTATRLTKRHTAEGNWNEWAIHAHKHRSHSLSRPPPPPTPLPQGPSSSCLLLPPPRCSTAPEAPRPYIQYQDPLESELKQCTNATVCAVTLCATKTTRRVFNTCGMYAQ